jgi:hypothetical protein
MEDDRVTTDNLGQPAGQEQPSQVILRGRTEPPLVLGREQPTLTSAQYDVIKALLDAGEKGLSQNELIRKSGHSDARHILERLARKSAEWAKVIFLPGKTGGGYHLRRHVL